MAEAESSEVLNAIMSPSPAGASGAGEAGGEAAARPVASPTRGADGRFAPADQPEADDADDEQPLEAEAEQEPAEDEQPEQEEAEEEAPASLDAYTVEVMVDGKPTEVTLGELKQSYSGTQYIAANVQKAVEHRKQAEIAQAQAYQVLEQSNQELEALQSVWAQYARPQVDLETLKHTDPQRYALERVKLMDAQERVQKIQQEIDSRRQKQAELVAEARARRVEDETRILLQKLPALADPQKAPMVMGKIHEVAQSYGVTDEELNSLDGHVPVLVLAEVAYLRERVAMYEQRLNRPTGEQPRPKTLIRPGTTKPAQSQSKRLEASILNRAKKTGRPDDVAATLLVSRKRA